MKTKLASLGTGLQEASLLLAVVCVPLFVDYYGFRLFEMGKGALLLALALTALLGGIVALAEGGMDALRGLIAALRRPLAATAVLGVLAAAIATAASTARAYSLYGSPERAFGLVTSLSLLVLFAAAANVGRAPDRRRRLVAALIAGSVPVSVYALTQFAGLEAVAGTAENERVFGTMANPIFLGAYLMLVAPLTVARLAAAARAARAGSFAGYVVVLAIQLVALALTASRGPQLGLVAGLLALAFAGAVATGRRNLAGGVLAAAVAALALLALAATPGGPLRGLAGVPLVGRFAEIGDVGAGSQAVRLRIWDTAAAIAGGASPARLVVGHGPETFRFAALPHGATYLGGRGQADRIVDRAHSVPFDALVTTGVLGLVALLGFWAAWLAAGAEAAGLVPTARERRLLWVLLAGGAAAGAASWLVAPRMAGALMALGLLAGLAAYLVLAWLRGHATGSGDLPALSLLAVGVALVAEAAFGIQTVGTQTVAVVLAGLLLALGLPRPEETAAEAAAPSRRRSAPAALAAVLPGWSPGGAALGLAAGAGASLVVFDLLRFGVQRLPETGLVAGLLVGALLLAGLLAAVDAGERAPGFLLAMLATLAVYSVARSAAFLITSDPATVYAVTVGWLIVLALLGAVLVRGRAPARAPFVAGPQAIAYPLLAAALVVPLYLLAIRPVQGDIDFQTAIARFQIALARDDEAMFRAGENGFARATRRNPHDDGYYLAWGQLYTQLAEAMAPGGIDVATPAYQTAQQLLGAAETVNPAMLYHTFNRAHLQLLFAQQLIAANRPDEAARIAQGCEQAFQVVFDRIPYDPQVANELALAQLMQGTQRLDQAITVLEYSRDHLDSENPQTMALLAQAYGAAGREDDAAEARARAEALGAVPPGAQGESGAPAAGGGATPGSPAALLQEGDAARMAGDLATARARYEAAITALGAEADWRVLYNFGLILFQLRAQEEAVQALTSALQRAPDADSQGQVQAALMQVLQGSVPVPEEMGFTPTPPIRYPTPTAAP